jgi:hypothetical protein
MASLGLSIPAKCGDFAGVPFLSETLFYRREIDIWLLESVKGALRPIISKESVWREIFHFLDLVVLPRVGFVSLQLKWNPSFDASGVIASVLWTV